MKPQPTSARGTRSLALLGALATAFAAGCGRPPHRDASLSVAAALSQAPLEGFEVLGGPRELSFPADHGPHPGFRSEWWYFTGPLQTSDGRRFGFQLTFFRTALAPPDSSSAASVPAASDPVASDDGWRSREVWMAHVAVSDVAGERFHAFETFDRGARGLAGARAQPFHVWTSSWSATSLGPELFPLRLSAQAGAAAERVAIDLTLDAAKPLVLNGDRGYSRKGGAPENASMYYSFSSLTARGTVDVDATRFEVGGKAWFDREWSTSVLDADLAGWDWFALSLDDGRELMSYRLRRSDGTFAPTSGGTLIEVDGSSRVLLSDEVRVDVLAQWTSPDSGIRYPSRWRLRVPSADLDLDVRPELADQELDLSFRYWEGVVEARTAGRSAGRGYVELVGYSEH